MKFSRLKTLLSVISFVQVIFLLYTLTNLRKDGRSEFNLRVHNKDLNVTVGLHPTKSFSGAVDTTGKCKDITSPTPKTQTWLPVDLEGNVYIYSAYIMESGHDIIIVGAEASNLRLFCQHWNLLNATFTSVSQPVKRNLLGESHGAKYDGAIYKCPWNHTVLTHVSITTNQCDTPLHLLPVVNASSGKPLQRRFTVCLKPLHFRYGRAFELIEWIELNKLIGVEKVIVYNYSIADNVDQVLRYYAKQGLIDIIQWHLPMRTYTHPRIYEPEIHSIGMIPMLQDCLLRQRKYSEFVINMDVDEFIIPYVEKVTTLNGILDSISPDYDVYMFRNTFFRKEWTTPEINHSFAEEAERLKLVTLRIFQREQKIYGAGDRSKYIVRTNKLSQLHIHSVYVENQRKYVVPEHLGLLHHYRNWEKYNDQSERRTETIILDRYGKMLVANVRKIWENLRNVTMHIPFV